MRNTFDAILFDNDGVLVDSEAIYIATECELLAEIGLAYDHTTYLNRFVGLSMPDYFRELAIDYQARVGGEFPPDFEAALSRRTWLRMEAELKALPHSKSLIDKFGGPVAVASSMPLASIHRKLSLVDLGDVFGSHVYSAEQVENGEPAPDPFLLAAQRLRVDQERCLVIEDSVNGVRAGVAAQMTVFGFIGGSHADESLGARLLNAGATQIFHDHAEIAQTIVIKKGS